MTPKVSILIPVWNQEKLVIKALDHIPRRDDIEVIVRDDGSTDNTLSAVIEYKETHKDFPLTVYFNGKNLGLYATMNLLLADAKGEYFHQHNSDDYVDTQIYSELIDMLNGMDVLTMDLRINDGAVWPVNESTNRIHCAQAIRFIRKKFVEGLKFNEQMKAASDWYYNEDMLKRNPKIVYSGKVAYMYNYPRDGSLVNLRARGIIGE